MRRLLLLFLSPVCLFSQDIYNKEFVTESSFIENKGQFDGRNWNKNKEIEYALDYDDSYVFFTKSGLTYRFDKIIRNPDRDKSVHDSPKRTNISELIHVEWIGSNTNTKIVAEEKIPAYYSYAIKDLNTKEVRNENYIPGFKKITYKNLYDKIDVEYEIHPETGFKYSFILHPGADPSQIKMKFSKGNTNIGSEFINYQLNAEGQMEIKTSLGEVTEHKPVTYYENSKNQIKSAFIFENDILSFDIENYNNTQEIVIDPWVVSPNFNSSTAVWEVEADGSGNVYVIGGETPMELRKYNSTGIWQWTYTTPWDTASVWLGTLATDAGGVSYITSGTSPEMERITPAGSMVWHTNGGGGVLGASCEWWSITFNCDKTKLIVGGTYVPGIFSFDYYSAIYDIDLTNGDVLGYVTFGMVNIGGFGTTPIEVRSISSSKDAKYVFLTHVDVGAINQTIGACPTDVPVYQVDNGHHLGYKCENYLPATQNGGGLKALIANDQFFYTNSGDEVHQRNLSDGSLITSVALPGGNSSVVPLIGGLVVENSGMAVDDCGNVYAGSGDRVVKFDANLNILSQVNVPFTVYDVSVNSNGEVIAVGAVSDNQSVNRSGKIQAINMTACAQFALICCDVNICPVDTVCDDDPAFIVTVSSPGGTFSGTGITNTSTGLFNPATAGVGSHVITYTKPCGSETVTIVVDPCDPITICYDGTNLIATGGTGTISWQNWQTYSYPITNEQECLNCPGATPQYVPFIGTYLSCTPSTCSGSGFVQYATGSTATLPATWPMQVSDNTGVVATYNNIGEVPPCAPCTNPTLTAVVTNVTCSGGTNGAINVTLTPGSGSSYTYSWTGPGGYTSTSIDITGLLAGSYTITATDATNPSCFATLTVSVGPGAATDNASFTVNSYCQGSANSATVTGTPGGTFSFNPVPTNGETINPSTGAITGGIGGNTYTIQYTTNGVCPASSTHTVTVYANPLPSISGSTSFCTGGSTTLDAGAGYTSYAWSNSGNTQTITVSTAGNYTVTVTDSHGCTGTALVAVTVAANLTPNISGILSICSGAATTLDAGSGYATYLWSTGATTQTINVSAAGTYSVTVTNGAGGPSVFWTENFQNSCASACMASGYSGANGPWSVTPTGANGADANEWFVSGSECGNAAGACGTSCGATDPSLHVGSTTVGNDPGAAYMAGGLGFWFPETDKRADSPTINCTGKTNITLSFNYIENGQLAIDNATLWYFNGATWSLLADLAKTAGTCSPQGLWTAYSIAMPASADNNPNVKIGFRWVNNDDNVGTDPSFAVDDIELSSPSAGSCSGTDQVIVTTNTNPTPNITGSLSFCTGGSTVLDAGAGYTSYAWTPSGTTQTVSVNTAGTYSVTVTDSNGCTGSDQVIVTVAANLSPSITGVLTICSGAATTLDAGSGYSTYNWSQGGTNQTISVTSAGTYSVTVSDASGCTGTDQVDVTTNTNPTPNITGALSFCTGNSTTLDAGAGYNSYNWSPSGTTQSINVTTGGTYTVTVTDNNGCTGTDQVVVTVAANLTPDITGVLSICSGAATTLDAGNGYANYLWSNSDISQTINVTIPGTYSVTVSDASGCTGTDQVVVSTNTNPTPDITGALSFCAGASTVLNAGAGYSIYSWSPSGNAQTLTVSTAGTYSVTVTDINGCTGTDQVDVTESSSIIVTLIPTDVTCYGESNGEISAVITGGTIPYTFAWSNGADSQDITNIPAGLYHVTVTDFSGCTGTNSVTLTQPPEVILVPCGSKFICTGQSAVLSASASGGVSPYTYYWNGMPGSAGYSVSPSVQTAYSVYVTDANGCSSSIHTITVYVSPAVGLDLSANTDHICPGDEVIISMNITPGVPPYYIYNDQGMIINPPLIVYPYDTTTYNVYVVDQCGSSSADELTIYTYPLPEVFFSADTMSGCQPLTVQFNSQYTAASYEWNFGDNDVDNLSFENDPMHIFDNPGSFTVSLTATSPEGCKNTYFVEDMIQVYPNPNAKFIVDPDAVSIVKPVAYFYNLSSGHVDSYWSFGDGYESNLENPYHSYPIYPTGIYNVMLVVISDKGCVDTTYHDVIVENEYTFYAPSAFSPDNDGINDVFNVFGNGIDKRNFKMIIYDRWGEEVFETEDMLEGWDGRINGGEVGKIGTYTWLVVYRDLRGIEKEEAGAVSIIR